MTTEGDDGPLEIQVPMAFEARDEATANWVVRKIIEARKYADRVEAWAAAEVVVPKARKRSCCADSGRS